MRLKLAVILIAHVEDIAAHSAQVVCRGVSLCDIVIPELAVCDPSCGEEENEADAEYSGNIADLTPCSDHSLVWTREVEAQVKMVPPSSPHSCHRYSACHIAVQCTASMHIRGRQR